jgi:hypothetical protein
LPIWIGSWHGQIPHRGGDPGVGREGRSELGQRLAVPIVRPPGKLHELVTIELGRNPGVQASHVGISI